VAIAHAGERAQRCHEVLARLERPDARDVGTVDPEARQQLGPCRRRAEPRLDPVGRHADPLLGHAQVLGDVARGRLRAGQHDRGAARERAGERAEVRSDRRREQLRDAQHEDVVHRHHDGNPQPRLG
jgi:hypothetical protein